MTHRCPRSAPRLAAPVGLAIAVTASAGCANPYCRGEDCLEPAGRDDDTAGDDDHTPGDDDTTASDDTVSDDDTGNGDDTTPPLVTERSCAVDLRWVPPGNPASVAVSGEWNGWSPQAMSGPDGAGAWSASLGDLAAGEYAFKYVLDGVYEGDPPADAYSHWVGGIENRNLRVRDCHRPLLQVVTASATAAGTLQAEVQFARAASGPDLDPASVQVTVGGEPVLAEIDEATGRLTIDSVGLAPGKHSLRVLAADTAGTRAEDEPLYLPLWVEEEPFEWRDALLYFTFTDRFRDGDWGAAPLLDPVPDVSACANYAGGDFLGILDALEEGYFSDLGARALWLSPALENPEHGEIGQDGVHLFSGYHGYWPTAPLAIEARLGDADGAASERLHQVVAEAHRQGTRVLFDLVLNHVHAEHTYTQEHPEWFGAGCVCGSEGCDWDGHARDCWFTPYLPDLDYRNHEVLMRVVEDTLALVREYDVDALRIDAAKHMDHVIMRTLAMRLRDDIESHGGAPFWLVGETFSSDRRLIMEYVRDSELDGQFDFPLYYGIRDSFIHGGSFRGLDQAVQDGMAAYGDALMSPFLGNHDVERFATAVTGRAGDCWAGWLDEPMAEGDGSVTQWDLINRQSMALAFTLTAPGVPLLYYGDEIGLAGGGDPDNRRQMDFDPNLSANQAELLGRTQAIGRARAESRALRRGARHTLWVDDDLLVVGFDTGDGDTALVAMNKGATERREDVSLAPLAVGDAHYADHKAPGRGFDAVSGRLDLTLGSWDYAVLLPE